MEPATAAEARSFGKYTLVAKLATGGMAEIFLARLHGDGGFEKLVCIKRILPHLARDAQFVSMFLDEARVAARISHPNVCQVFELGEWNGQYYIAMEYLEGVPLSCFRRGDYYPLPPDPRLVAGFGVQACEGLHNAHQLKANDGELLGVVHRDVSPQNLFVTVDGVVKVLDFGIAKVQDASSKTSTGAVKGTYAYMAPEQLRNEPLDRRTDVWALGTVLWETLAQRHLFKRETEFLTFQAITHEEIPNICDVRPDVPPLVGDVIARALSRKRDDRFGSARALGEALAQAVAPLGGAANSAAISEEVSAAFAVQLAEQHTLLRIAREGGQFDLEAESPLVGHGTQLATTPASSLKRRVAEAQAEVAQFVAAQQAIDSLAEDGSSPGYVRPDSEGAFTPAPPRGPSQAFAAQAPRRTSKPMPAQPGPYSVAPAEWTAAEVTPPPPPQPTRPFVVEKSSRLPWIIALVAVLAAACAGVLLYLNLTKQKAPAQPAKEVAMTETAPVAPAAVPPADAAIAVEEPPIDAAPITPPVDAAAAVAVKLPAAHPHPQAVRPVVEKEKEPSGPPGFITIDSAPVYAVIYIDGKKYGETPLVKLKLPPGRHSVKAVSPTGGTKNVSISIESGKTAPVRKIEW
jgi:serine/threonine-protein kinase